MMNRSKLAKFGAGAGLLAAVGVGTTLLGVAATSGPASAAGSATPSLVVQSATGGASAATPTPASTPTAVSLPRFRRLTPPDAVVRLDRAASARSIARLKRLPGVRQVAVLSRGPIALTSGKHQLRLEIAGVPIRQLRGFTPKLTAVSAPLWQSIASGELAVSYASDKPIAHRLGATLPVRSAGHRPIGERIGAFATLGVPGVDGFVSVAEARALHLPAAREIVIHAPNVSLAQLKTDVYTSLNHVANYTVTRPVPFTQTASAYAVQVIPHFYLGLYQQAATTCPGLPWTVLAGIGTVETGNGTDVHKSIAGAEGPMQFMPSTWAEYGVDADGDGKANINDPTDAVFSAARYLCASGASEGGQALDDAIYAYNHAWWYVREVVNLANSYA